jgi:siroheme synthase
VIAVENASFPDSRRWTTTLGGLPGLADEAFAGPVMLLLGEALAAAAAAADPDRVRTEFLEAAEAHLLRAAV